MFSKLMTVNSTGADEEIIAVTVCKSVVFGEDASVVGWPTLDWLWKAPDSTDYKQQPAGTSMLFAKPGGAWYFPGERVAYVKTASGSSTFIQTEQ